MKQERRGITLKGLLVSAALGLGIAYVATHREPVETPQVISAPAVESTLEKIASPDYAGPKLILQRTYEQGKRTKGKLYEDRNRNGVVDSGDNYLTQVIEPAWLNNRIYVSCIPEGTYLVRGRSPSESGKFSYKHFKVRGQNSPEVPDRRDILIHGLGKTEGCLMTNDLPVLVNKYYSTGFQLIITKDKK